MQILHLDTLSRLLELYYNDSKERVLYARHDRSCFDYNTFHQKESESFVLLETDISRLHHKPFFDLSIKPIASSSERIRPILAAGSQFPAFAAFQVCFEIKILENQVSELSSKKEDKNEIVF